MSEVFEKGMQVRIVEGDNQGVVGKIFWIGQSKHGPEMRAGVTSEEDESQVWVMAGEMRAIDEDGAELDPQPGLPLTGTPSKQKYTIRAIDVPYEMARVLTSMRIEMGYPPGKATSATVRMDLLEETERTLDCTIPDVVIAYITAGIGQFRAKDVSHIVDVTQAFLEQAKPGQSVEVAGAETLVFDVDGDDYLAFERGAGRDSRKILQFDVTGGTKKASAVDMLELLKARASKVPSNVEALELVVDYVSREEPEEEESAARWVVHPKFGRARVIDIEPSSKGDKLTLEFEDGETRKLLARFVEFE